MVPTGPAPVESRFGNQTTPLPERAHLASHADRRFGRRSGGEARGGQCLCGSALFSNLNSTGTGPVGQPT